MGRKKVAKKGAKLFVTDIKPDVIQKLKNKYTLVEEVSGDAIYSIEADIFCPCAIGGIITSERIEQMKFSIIMGPANNQLAATSNEEEIELAKKLQNKGILYQIEWKHNTAGVIAAWEEYVHQDRAKMKHVMGHIEKVCREGTRNNLHLAKERGITPTENAYRMVEELIY